jgi:threonine dehydratase
LNQALKAGRRVTLKQVGLFADGVAVKQIGKEPFHIAQHHVDEVITVSTDEICAATKDLFDETRSIAEPAGALAMAGLKKYIETHQPENQHLIAITSGANINFDRLRHMAERTLLGEHRELLMAVTIPEQPGSFLNFCEALGQRNITEFNYRYAQATQAHIFVGVQIERHEAELLMASLRKKGYEVTDMTTNELAIEHMRFMVGGHAPNIVDELVYRFEFPERPGALLAFLTALSGRWNISLFHYRNHGSAFGRVLMGMQVQPRDRPRFKSFLKEAGIAFQEETQNPAYALFAGDKSPT